MASQELPLFGQIINSPTHIPAISSFPLNAVGIFRESVKIPSRNGKLILQVLLTILLPFSLLVLLHCYLEGPLIEKVEESYEENNSVVDHKLGSSLLGHELFFLCAYWVLCFFGMVLTIQASASVYLAKNIKLSDLLFGFRVCWRKPLITWVYVLLLNVLYAFVVLVLVELLKLISTIGGASSWVMIILGVGFYLFLDAHWTLGLVVSIMEDEGNALGRARKLIRGRQLQGFLLLLILVLLSAPIYVFFYVTATDDDDDLGPFAQFAFGFLSTLLFCVAKFFVFVVFTVFYFECKQSHGENVGVEAVRSGYCLVSRKIELDSSFH